MRIKVQSCAVQCTRTPEVRVDGAVDERVESRTGDTRSGRGGGAGKARAVAEPNSASPPRHYRARTRTGGARTRRLRRRRLAAAASALGACEREHVGHTDFAVEELVLFALVLVLRLRRQRVQYLYNIQKYGTFYCVLSSSTELEQVYNRRI